MDDDVLVDTISLLSPLSLIPFFTSHTDSIFTSLTDSICRLSRRFHFSVLKPIPFFASHSDSIFHLSHRFHFSSHFSPLSPIPFLTAHTDSIFSHNFTFFHISHRFHFSPLTPISLFAKHSALQTPDSDFHESSPVMNCSSCLLSTR